MRKFLLIQIGLILAIPLFLWLFFSYGLNIMTDHNEYVKVPDLTGKTLKTVKIELKKQHLNFKSQDSANYNPKIPKYAVISQNPPPHAEVKTGRKIYLVINQGGYRFAKVPNILGLTLRQAQPTLKALHFKLGRITYVKAIGEGVIAMYNNGKRIKPDDKLQITSTIDLQIGDGSSGID